MRVIFLHIPKTAGSTVSSLLHRKDVRGRWLLERDLWDEDPEQLWANDILAGHFTRNHIRRYTTQHGLSLDGVRFVSVIRNPIDQVFSNLNYPFELVRRGDALDDWMHDVVACQPNDPHAFIAVLEKNPWLMNMQTRYLMLDHEMIEPSLYDRLGVFPDLDYVRVYLSSVLGLGRAPPAPVHSNKAERLIGRDMFRRGPLADYIAEHNAADEVMYKAITGRLMRAA